VNIRGLDRNRLRHENAIETQRLCPWPVLNAPFEGSWCVVRAGVTSTLDRHPDYEMWIAMTGQAVVEVGGEERSFSSGDVLYLPPETPHRVINRSDRDFEMYSVWWDRSLAGRFNERHEAGAPSALEASST
jgi:mannose-6-phosphate isomerase-like protein (cupin superfamily)